MDSIWQQALDPWKWLVLVHLLFWLAISARVLLRSDLSPDVRVAWLLVLLLLPYGGVVLFFLFGEVYLGRALARLLADPGLAGRLGQGGRAAVTGRYSPAAVAEALGAAYARLDRGASPRL